MPHVSWPQDVDIEPFGSPASSRGDFEKLEERADQGESFRDNSDPTQGPFR